MNQFFITASDTGVGKTLVTTALCWQLRQRGIKVTALKPVITGFREDDENSDTAQILHSCGVHPTPAVMKTISPWQFEIPVAPHMATDNPKEVPKLDEVVSFCKSHSDTGNMLLAEGFGGVMAPLNYDHTVRDIIEGVGWPAILVGGSYVGSISHTLMAYESLRIRNIPVQAVVIGESKNSAARLGQTVNTIEKFIDKDTPVIKIPRINADHSPWKHVPLIHWIVSDERAQQATV